MSHDNRESFGEDMRTANDILACIEANGPLSRAAAAKQLDLSRTTLSNLVARLIDRRLVAELDGGDPSGRGRPGIPVDLDATTWFALGAEFHSNRWVFVLANLKGEVVSTRTVDILGHTPKSFIESLLRGIRALRSKAQGRLLPAVGLGVPGLVDWEKGTIVRAADLGWEGVEVGGVVEEELGLPAYVINRNRAAGLAEARFGRGRNIDNFVYVGIGTGISAAIMLKGDLLHGCGYSAGEIGHIVVDPDGPLCGCGHRGCLQTMAAEGALIRFARDMFEAGRLDGRSRIGKEMFLGHRLTGEIVCRAALAGDEDARACVRAAAGYLGRAVGTMVTVLNSRKIILGGPLVRVGPLLVDFVREEAAKWAMPQPFQEVEIESSAMDEYAGALGAACLVLRNKLELSSRALSAANLPVAAARC